jgi:hypothetical protein
MKKIVLVVAMVIGGCSAQPPVDAFRLTETSLQDRQLQSRFYETSDETRLLVSGVGALQDMGFTLDETEKTVGLITASKTVDAQDGGQMAALLFLSAFSGVKAQYDNEQTISVSFVTFPSKAKSGYMARISFQRVIRSQEGRINRVETLSEPKLYEEFFDKLSKSVFIEGQSI